MIEIRAPRSIGIRPCCPALVDLEVSTSAARAPRLEVEDEAGASLEGIVAHAFEAEEGEGPVNGIALFRARLLVPAGGLLADGRSPRAIVVRALSRFDPPAEARINVVRSL